MSAKIFKTNANVTVNTDFTTLLTVGGGFGGDIAAEVHNAGAVALSDFRIQAKVHPGSEFFTVLAGTDFDSTTNLLLKMASETGPHQLGGAARANLLVNIGPVFALRFQAKTASSTTTVGLRGRAERG